MKINRFPGVAPRTTGWNRGKRSDTRRQPVLYSYLAGVVRRRALRTLLSLCKLITAYGGRGCSVSLDLCLRRVSLFLCLIDYLYLRLVFSLLFSWRRNIFHSLCFISSLSSSRLFSFALLKKKHLSLSLISPLSSSHLFRFLKEETFSFSLHYSFSFFVSPFLFRSLKEETSFSFSYYFTFFSSFLFRSLNEETFFYFSLSYNFSFFLFRSLNESNDTMAPVYGTVSLVSQNPTIL